MFKNSFSFEGRIRRTEYGLTLLIGYAATFMIGFIYGVITQDTSPIVHLFCLPVYWFQFAQGAKRCHDRGNSGWYQIIPFYVLWMLFGEGEKGYNDYGEDPKDNNNEGNDKDNENINDLLQNKLIEDPVKEPIVEPIKTIPLTAEELFAQANDLFKSRKHKKGIDALTASAEMGYADAQNALGMIYDMGEYVPRNSALAFTWIEQAAEQDHPDAIFTLGAMYGKGEVVEQDKEKSFSLLKKAAKLGHTKAIEVIANMRNK